MDIRLLVDIRLYLVSQKNPAAKINRTIT